MCPGDEEIQKDVRKRELEKHILTVDHTHSGAVVQNILPVFSHDGTHLEGISIHTTSGILRIQAGAILRSSDCETVGILQLLSER